MTATDVALLLRDLGGYGVAALMWWLYRQEQKERFRYRDQFEKVLGDLPKLTDSLERLTNEVEKHLVTAPKERLDS